MISFNFLHLQRSLEKSYGLFFKSFRNSFAEHLFFNRGLLSISTEHSLGQKYSKNSSLLIVTQAKTQLVALFFCFNSTGKRLLYT